MRLLGRGVDAIDVGRGIPDLLDVVPETVVHKREVEDCCAERTGVGKLDYRRDLAGVVGIAVAVVVAQSEDPADRLVVETVVLRNIQGVVRSPCQARWVVKTEASGKLAREEHRRLAIAERIPAFVEVLETNDVRRVEVVGGPQEIRSVCDESLGVSHTGGRRGFVEEDGDLPVVVHVPIGVEVFKSDDLVLHLVEDEQHGLNRCALSVLGASLVVGAPTTHSAAPVGPACRGIAVRGAAGRLQGSGRARRGTVGRRLEPGDRTGLRTRGDFIRRHSG